MECYVHPDQDAVGACVACGNFVCDTCRVTVKGRMYCKACVERGDATPPPPSPQAGGAGTPLIDTTLRRSRSDKMIAGVCGGLAKQFQMDPSLVRVLVAVAFFVTGFFPIGVIYVIFWAALPEGD